MAKHQGALAYDRQMRRFSWLVIGLLLLQLSWGSVWGMPMVQITPPNTAHTLPACHGAASQLASIDAAAKAHTPETAGHAQATGHDCHHCCVMGLPELVLQTEQALPKAAPAWCAPGWSSVCLRSDLRPPIA